MVTWNQSFKRLHNLQLSPNRLLIFIPVSILLNMCGYVLNYALPTPLFLDSTGTILLGAAAGPWIGGLVGFLSNLIVGVFQNPVTIPFGLVNGLIGLTVGFISMKRGFSDPWSPLLAGCLLAVLCPLLAAPITVYLFGGITGGYIDKFVTSLILSGHGIFASAFLTRIYANLADKLICGYFVFILLKCMPPAWRGLAATPEKIPADSCSDFHPISPTSSLQDQTDSENQ